MKKLIIPKINSNNFGGKWILTAFIVGGIIPLLLWLLFHVFVWVLCVAGAIIFLGFIDKENSHFTEVMLIKTIEDEERFKKIFDIKTVKIEY